MNKQQNPFEVIVVGERPPLIDPSKEYRAGVVEIKLPSYYRGGEKIYIYFELLDFPPEGRPVLFKPYNWYKPLRSGSYLFKDCERILGKRIKSNTTIKINNIFYNKVFIITVRTVTKNAKGYDLPINEQWSVIDEIVRVEMTDEIAVTGLEKTQKEINDDDVPF